SIFELVFLSEQLQTCLEDALGHRKLRIHVACALSFDGKMLGKIYDKKLIYVLRQLPDGFVKNGNVKRPLFFFFFFFKLKKNLIIIYIYVSSLLFGMDPMALLLKAAANKSSRRILVMEQSSTNMATAGLAQVSARSRGNSPSITHSRRHSLNMNASPLGSPFHNQSPSPGGGGGGGGGGGIHPVIAPSPMTEDLTGNGKPRALSRQRSNRNNSIDMGEVNRWQEWQREQDEKRALEDAATNKDKESVLSAPYIELPIPKILPLSVTTDEYHQKMKEKEKEKERQKPPSINIDVNHLIQPQSPVLTPDNRTILHFLSIPYNPVDS
ncbi:hypothetical protein RFI_25695, partial [Reticulomyxa filosa]